MPHSVTCHPAAVINPPLFQQSWCSIKRPRRDARLSWPSIYARLKTVTLPSTNRARRSVTYHSIRHAGNLYADEWGRNWNVTRCRAPRSVRTPAHPFTDALLQDCFLVPCIFSAVPSRRGLCFCVDAFELKRTLGCHYSLPLPARRGLGTDTAHERMYDEVRTVHVRPSLPPPQLVPYTKHAHHTSVRASQKITCAHRAFHSPEAWMFAQSCTIRSSATSINVVLKMHSTITSQ